MPALGRKATIGERALNGQDLTHLALDPLRLRRLEHIALLLGISHASLVILISRVRL